MLFRSKAGPVQNVFVSQRGTSGTGTWKEWIAAPPDSEKLGLGCIEADCLQVNIRSHLVLESSEPSLLAP